MVGPRTITSELYPMTDGVCSVVPLDDFPLPCTKCEQGTMTEDCNYEAGVCITLSDTSVSVIGTNATVLDNGQFSLDSQCTPRYLQKLTHVKYAVICWESSYHLFHTDYLQLDRISSGEDGARDGILVQSSSDVFGRQTHLHHVEIHDSDHSVYIYDILGGVSDLIYPDYDCMYDSLALHPIFSSYGTFFLSCSTANEAKMYFLLSTDTYGSSPIRVTLCSDPLSYPESSTFAVACNYSLVIYMKNDMEYHHSMNFSSSITFFSYLDPTTLILDTGNQHIVSVELFMNSGGSDGVLALNSTNTNCSLIRKRLTPDVYATVCASGGVYNVQLFNTTQGQPLPPVSNLTEEPLTVYFNFQEPPTLPGPPNTTNHTPTTPIAPTDSSSTTSITPTDSSSITTMPTDLTQNTPSEDENPPTKPGKSTSGRKILLPVLLTVGGVLVLATGIMILLVVCIVHSHRQKAPPNMSTTNSSFVSSRAGSQEDMEWASLPPHT